MYHKSTILGTLLFGSLFVFGSSALATSVDRMSLINLEGYSGKTITQEMTLEGTDLEDRSGFWYAHYKKTEGDNDRMDITSWITIEPKDFNIKQGETKVFTVNIKIPKNAEPGLWGATSIEAGKEGHSGERRTYIVFKDAPADGNVYSGLLIPLSIKVLPSLNPFAPIINFVMKNLIVIVLSVVIIVLLAMQLSRRKKRSMRL